MGLPKNVTRVTPSGVQKLLPSKPMNYNTNMEQEIISIIKSCIVSRKGGMPLIHLNGEYSELTGETIPFRKLGYETLGRLLCSIPDISFERTKEDGTVIHVVDEKVAHIQELIEKQKSAQKRKQGKENIYRHEFNLKSVKTENTRSSYKHKNEYTRPVRIAQCEDMPVSSRRVTRVDGTLRMTIVNNIRSNRYTSSTRLSSSDEDLSAKEDDW